jgi:hypothetical protein
VQQHLPDYNEVAKLVSRTSGRCRAGAAPVPHETSVQPHLPDHNEVAKLVSQMSGRCRAGAAPVPHEASVQPHLPDHNEVAKLVSRLSGRCHAGARWCLLRPQSNHTYPITTRSPNWFCVSGRCTAVPRFLGNQNDENRKNETIYQEDLNCVHFMQSIFVGYFHAHSKDNCVLSPNGGRPPSGFDSTQTRR